MSGAVETHFDLRIETDVPEQLTSRCGCGWSTVIDEATAAGIVSAREAFYAHDCPGRPLFERERQPRERSVPCQRCLRPTFDVDAICDDCKSYTQPTQPQGETR